MLISTLFVNSGILNANVQNSAGWRHSRLRTPAKARCLPSLCLLLGTLVAQPALAYSIYVSSEKDNTISVIDGDSLEVIDTIEVGERPRGIVLSHDGKLLYVCTSDEDHVEALDIETGKVLYTLPSGPDPELMSLSADGTRLYIANEDDNMVTVVDVVERRVR